MGKTQAFHTRLVVHIHIVELQLAELPAVIAIENVLENIQAIVEAKSQMPDAAVCFCFFCKGNNKK